MTPERIAQLEALEAALAPLLAAEHKNTFDDAIQQGQNSIWHRYTLWFVEASRKNLGKEEMDRRFAVGEVMREFMLDVIERVEATSKT